MTATRLLLSFSFLFVFATCVMAQQPQQSPRILRSDADEVFELNIAERHLVENDFEAGTVLTAGQDSRQVRVQVGVALRAERIDVKLLNVQGRVRFRGSLRAILERLNLHANPSNPR